jgi:hypothetical protein
VPTSRARDKSGSGSGSRASELEYLWHVYTPSEVGSLPAQFASFATTIQNRLDNGGSSSSIGLNGSLEAQVERALSLALRQSAPSGSNGASGSVATALALSTASGQVLSNGSSPGLSTAQTVLVGEAALVQADMLAALDALQPLSMIADASDVAAYRSIVRAEVLALTAEFARPDQPRPIRARVLFGALLGWGYAPDYLPTVVASGPSGDVAALNFLFNLGSAVVPSALTEDQLALQGVLAADAARLFDLWKAYQYQGAPFPWSLKDVDGNLLPTPAMWPDAIYQRKNNFGGLAALTSGGTATEPFNLLGSPVGPAVRQLVLGQGASNATVPPPLFSFSERMIRADLLLPVLSSDADQVAGALDAVGFGPGPQETTPIPDLQSASDADLAPADAADPVALLALPIQMAQQQIPTFGPTVKDLLDWARDLAGGAGYDLLRQAGQLGLDLLADQADELFWVVAALLENPPMPELSDTQVRLELLSLARDLSALADLSN